MKRVAALLILAMWPSAIGADGVGEKRLAFARKMAPKVGQEVRVSGVVMDSKSGCYLMTDDGGEVYLESASGEPARRFDFLKNWNGKRLAITGTLGYREPSAAPRASPTKRREHFYLDTTKPVEIVRVDQAL